MNLAQKNIVITGGAGGLGLALAKELLKQGACVTLTDRDAKALQVAKKNLEDLGFNVDVYRLDVTRPPDFLRLKNLLEKSGRSPHIWINNAGIAHPGNFDTKSPAEMRRLVDINFFGVLYGTRTAMEMMGAQGGRMIVNVASLAGILPAPYLATYAATKHAVVGFTRSLALECAWRGLPLKFVLVCPGFADTPMMNLNPRMKPPAFLVSTPQQAARQIVRGMISEQNEIYPGRGTQLSVAAQKMFPRLFSRMSRWMFANNLREWMGWESIQR